MLRILFGLAAVWMFAGGFGPASSAACGREFSSQGNCKPCKRPDGTLNHSPNVTEVILDRTQIRLKDPAPGPPPDEPVRSPDLIVNVATHAEDAENDVLDYYYVISGGRIVGSGSSVQWDLNGVQPGTYTITARVDDSCGVCGKTMTRAVLVIGKPVIVAAPKPIPAIPAATPAIVAATAPASTSTPQSRPRSANSSPSSPAVSAPTSTKAPTSVVIARTTPTRATVNASAAAAAASATAPCSCPKVVISDPERSDTDLSFTTKIFDFTGMNRLSYIWTVTGGTVVSQDGRTLRLKPGVLGGSVSVSVNGLDPKCSCPNKATKTF